MWLPAQSVGLDSKQYVVGDPYNRLAIVASVSIPCLASTVARGVHRQVRLGDRLSDTIKASHQGRTFQPVPTRLAYVLELGCVFSSTIESYHLLLVGNQQQ